MEMEGRIGLSKREMKRRESSLPYSIFTKIDNRSAYSTLRSHAARGRGSGQVVPGLHPGAKVRITVIAHPSILEIREFVLKAPENRRLHDLYWWIFVSKLITVLMKVAFVHSLHLPYNDIGCNCSMQFNVFPF